MIEIAKSKLHTSECRCIDNERVMVMKNLKYKLFVLINTKEALWNIQALQYP